MSAVGIPTTLSTDTIVVDLPDGLAAGDPFQVLIAHYGGTTTVTVPSGATLLSPPGLMTDGTNNSRGYLYSVVCPDPVPESMTWTLGAVRNAIGVAWVEDNQSTAPTTVAHATGSATVSGPNPPAITPASGGMRIVACGFHNRGYITTVPTGWQELFSVSAGGTTSSSVGAWAAVIDGPPTSTVVDPGIASFPGTTANWAATTMAITVGDPAPITPAPATGVTVSTGFLVDFTEPAGSIGHTVRVYPAGTAPAGT